VSHNLLIDPTYTDPLRERLGAFRSLHQLVATGLVTRMVGAAASFSIFCRNR
jgi:hypothetical protein